jgi:16S rRNA processing protein RimM
MEAGPRRRPRRAPRRADPASGIKPPAADRRADEPQNERIVVGRILGPHGVRGEVKVEPLTDNPARFRRGSRLFAGDQTLTVAAARQAERHLLVRFESLLDRTAVARLRGVMLEVLESELPALPEGEYYRHQLIGLTVVDTEGHTLGTLEQVLETGANDVYVVRTPDGGELLLPATPEVVLRMDANAGRLVVSPPDWT